MNIKTLGLASVIALSALSVATQAAQAGTLYKDWNYGIDSFTDGSGGAGYEINGMAIKQSGNDVFVALTGGTPLKGNAYNGAQGGSIGWGDLFFNFSGKDFKTASAAGNLFGIRFAAANDSNAASVGVYKNVTAKSVAVANVGYNSLQQYYDHGFDRTNTQGTDLATKQAAYDYFSATGPILNVIDKGTKTGGISFLSNAQLSAAGLDFGHFSAAGSQTIGFKLDRSLLGSGNFISNIFLECGNDGVALKGNLKAAPEPTTMAGLGLVGALLVARRRKVTA